MIWHNETICACILGRCSLQGWMLTGAESRLLSRRENVRSANDLFLSLRWVDLELLMLDRLTLFHFDLLSVLVGTTDLSLARWLIRTENPSSRLLSYVRCSNGTWVRLLNHLVYALGKLTFRVFGTRLEQVAFNLLLCLLLIWLLDFESFLLILITSLYLVSLGLNLRLLGVRNGRKLLNRLDYLLWATTRSTSFLHDDWRLGACYDRQVKIWYRVSVLRVSLFHEDTLRKLLTCLWELWGRLLLFHGTCLQIYDRLLCLIELGNGRHLLRYERLLLNLERLLRHNWLWCSATIIKLRLIDHSLKFLLVGILTVV